MNPKSGSASTPVTPEAPTAPDPADEADPGKVATTKARQIERKEGKYGSVKAAPFKPPPESPGMEPVETHWIEIELVGEDDMPIPGEAFRVELPDGTVTQGTLDHRGFARITGLPTTGACKVLFPRLDQDAWEFIETAAARDA